MSAKIAETATEELPVVPNRTIFSEAVATCSCRGERPDQDLIKRAARIRERIVQMCGGPEGGHLGGALSVVDVLTVLYFDVLHLDAGTVDAAERDITILSKGHAAVALYATLMERGILAEKHLNAYGHPGSALAGHPSPATPGVEVASGSLGHGLALGVGYALARRMNARGGRVVVILGDGEMQEGSVWEAALVAAARGLGNLTAVVDRNRFQQASSTRDLMSDSCISQAFSGMGWEVYEVDGHDFMALRGALGTDTTAAGSTHAAPRLVVANTVKAQGVSFLEGAANSHYVSLKGRTLDRALRSVQRGMTRPPTPCPTCSVSSVSGPSK